MQAGANVVMPNLSPENVRPLYDLYENKLSSGSEAAQGVLQLKAQMAAAGYRVVTDVGNVKRPANGRRAARRISKGKSKTPFL